MVEHIYDVTGMTCAACSARVKRTMDKLDGVAHCEVNLLTGKMTLGYDEKQLDFDGIQSAIEKAGYGVREPEQEDEHAVAEEEEKERKDSFRRLMVAVVCAVPVFYLNINHMIPAIIPAGTCDFQHVPNHKCIDSACTGVYCAFGVGVDSLFVATVRVFRQPEYGHTGCHWRYGRDAGEYLCSGYDRYGKP